MFKGPVALLESFVCLLFLVFWGAGVGRVIRDNARKVSQNQISKDIIDHTKEF